MSDATPLNLNESSEGMTFLQKQPEAPQKNTEYSAEIPKEEKKNNNSNNQNTQMDSTPLADILPSNDIMEPPQDPRMVQQSPMPIPQIQQQQPQPQPQQKQNPLNLTDEQMEALFVGVCAVIAFSKPVQDKLANFVPQFVGDDGARSATGLAVTGLVAALVFYFGQRMVLNRM